MVYPDSSTVTLPHNSTIPATPHPPNDSFISRPSTFYDHDHSSTSSEPTPDAPASISPTTSVFTPIILVPSRN